VVDHHVAVGDRLTGLVKINTAANPVGQLLLTMVGLVKT